jgi:hypothetical protein
LSLFLFPPRMETVVEHMIEQFKKEKLQKLMNFNS